MDKDGNNSSNRDLSTVYETIFLFLKNQNLFKSSEIFKAECESYGIPIPNVSGKVFFSTSQTFGSLEKSSSKAFVDKRIILETFLPQKQTEEIKNNQKESQSQNTLRRRFTDLQEEYKKLIAVTSELTNALQLNILGQTRNINYVLDQCKDIYPTLFKYQPNERVKDLKEPEHKESNIEPEQCQKEEIVKYSEIPILNLDCSSPNNNPQPQNHADKNSLPHTPLTQREIRDILETVLKRVTYVLDDESDKRDDCCEKNASCTDCKDEISQIIEKILIKVLESPRFDPHIRQSSSSTLCCNSRLSSTPTRRNLVGSTSAVKDHEYFVEVSSESDNRSFNRKIGNDQNGTSKRCASSELSSHAFTKTAGNNDENHVSSETEAQNSYSVGKNSGTLANEAMREEEGNNNAEGMNIFDMSVNTTPNDHECNFSARNDISEAQTESVPALANKIDNNVQPKTYFERIPNTTGALKFKYIPVGMISREPLTRQPTFNNSKVPFCYMEYCKRVQGNNETCRCIRCFPGQSRYYCGCYDTICNEIAEELRGLCEEQAAVRSSLFKNIRTCVDDLPKTLDQHITGNRCNICEDICKCAFESRPKIRRTPPD